ncbi:MAG: hypothetical protein CTY40_10635 [Hyphomicrobium sp.]|nr:MAG: hypothetical protein CTY40_10635 [Hyphomicrobium sp.]
MTAMKISEFRAGLKDLEAALRKWGSPKAASELAALVDALGEFDDLTIPELAKRVKAINAPAKSSPKSKEPNLAAVGQYLALLNESMQSTEAFGQAVATILADKKQMAQAELLELARQFAGGTPEKSTKPAIGAFLKARRLEMRRGEGLGATIDRMFGRH